MREEVKINLIFSFEGEIKVTPDTGAKIMMYGLYGNAQQMSAGECIEENI